MNEIERKFLIKIFPSIKNKKYHDNERFFLKTNNDNTEERIYKNNNKYFHEKKVNISIYERKKDKSEINKSEFLKLKNKIIWKTSRRTYYIQKSPKITLQVYKWKFKWLIRVEVEFNSINECSIFKPLYWMWKEITWNYISRDVKLIKNT